MIVPTLLYSFFLFLKLAVRLGLTGELAAAWPLWLGVAAGVNLYRLDNLLSVFSFRLSVYGLSVFSLPVLKRLINRKLTNLEPKTDNRELITENRSISQNILFAAGWAVVALFGMTSTIGFLGKGVVLGVGLQLAVRVAKDLFEFREKIRLKTDKIDWFYLPIKRQLTDDEKKWGAIIFLTLFAILSFF